MDTPISRILPSSGKLNKFFSVRDVQRKNWSGLSENEDIRKGLDVLVEHNYLRECLDKDTLGRPKNTYEIHNSLLPSNPVTNNKPKPKPKPKTRAKAKKVK